MEIDYLNKKYHLNIPASDTYETLAGFIFHHHENVPELNEEIIVPPFIFTILQVKDRRIKQVKMRIETEEE